MAVHSHGTGRITAALLMAPAASVVLLLGAVAVLPLPADVQTLIFFLGLAPAVTVASCLALLSRSGLRAWAGSATLAALGTLALVGS